jgi:hypothetical protein
MMKPHLHGSVARRSFLSRMGGGIAALGAAWGGGSTAAHAQTPAPTSAPASDGRWQPVRHAVDDWLDQLPGKHRLAFDTMTPDRLEDALQFAGNFY